MTEEDVDSPTCYRHPDRETYVQCTRCERYICPDCMKDAAVGFHCPECVKEGNASVRQARTIVGGRAVSSGLSVVNVLIAINVVMFLLQRTSSTLTNDYADLGIAVADGEYYRLITSAFLHANLLHLGLNMYFMFFFGAQLEEQLGRVRFIGLYLIAGLGGSVASYMFGHPLQASVGASGAIFGVLGGLFVVSRRLRRDTSQLTGLIVFNLIIGQIVPRIDNRAHIGGLLTGAALTYAWAHLPRSSARTALQAAAAVVMVVLLGVGIAVRNAEVRDKCFQGGSVAACVNARSASDTPVTGELSR